ncbi:hypothetical protein CBS470a_002429 [Colletotrichum nupharicola]|nr:hypothetical protein CBS470a_002429 [Colletotrichum nupharicola]
MASPRDDMSVDGDNDINQLVEDIVEASKLPAKKRATAIRPTVDKVASSAYENGLLPEPLNELIYLLTRPSYLDQGSLNALLKSLYPATKLSNDVVWRVVGCLGHGELKPSLNLQSNLLKWLIMAYHVIENPAVLSQTYAVLFNLLDTAAIRLDCPGSLTEKLKALTPSRPQLCHLLALITRRKHVRPFRIQLVADRLAQNIEKIELPNQLAAVLADPLLQKFIALKKDDAASRRVIHWVDAILEDVLNGNADDKLFNETMEILEDYVTRVKLSLLKLYQNLIRRWTFVLRSLDPIPPEAPVSPFYDVMEHAGIVALNLVQATPSVAVHGAVLDLYEQAATSISDPTLQPLLRIANPPAQLIYLLFFSHSLSNVSRLCAVLAVYKKGFETAMSRRQPTTYQPSYVNHFNGFLMDVCNCLWRGKAFNDADKNALGCLSARPVTLRLQRYVEDLGMDLALPTLFGFSYSPVLSLQAIDCIREREDRALAEDEDAIATRHGGPVTANSLARLAEARGIRVTWSEYRIQVLHALEGKGLGGIPALMRNTMKVLMGSQPPK